MGIKYRVSREPARSGGAGRWTSLLVALLVMAAGLRGQSVAEELVAIETAYGALKGLSAETVMQLHVLQADGSAGALLEESKGEMVWVQGLRHEKLDGVERYAGGGQLVMVDHAEKVVMVQPMNEADLNGPLPAFGEPVGELMKAVQKSELLPDAQGNRGIRLHYVQGLYSEVTIWCSTETHLIHRVELRTRATADEPALLLVTELKNLKANPVMNPGEHSWSHVVTGLTGKLALTPAYSQYQLIQ